MKKQLLPNLFFMLGRGWLWVCTLLLVTHIASAQQVDMDKFKHIKARSIGPAGMSGRVTAIDVVLDNPDIIYVGTASGGLWKSESGGIDWKPIFDEEKVASVGALAIYQKNPDIIWIGTGEGNPRNSQTSGAGVYRSLDGGKSWQLMGLEKTRNIHRIFIHPENPEIIYVGVQGSAWGTHPERGVYKTTDGGQTWEKILYVNEQTGVGDMVMDPQNPEKLIVALWEFRRWPWFFKSGGEGSGLYITYDGGKNWKEKTSEDGLPKGELGRMGLAIAPSEPDRVYALIESKKNALYRSDDGGEKWEMVNDTEDIVNRPFYYADIFVDPKNENRIYSLYSMVSRSEDGGKSFKVIVPYSGVHPDHHAFWIHPENHKYLILGNDGGLAISRDMGESWRFVENLPLAQFYHISVDTLMPYNVYGGMQDNGSWRGPAYTWRYGGIRNAYWEEVFFGDGFDVLPDPDYPERYGYAMSQGGNLGRFDLITGHSKQIKPVHPEGETLRFNWNAAIAQDPFDAATIYYGSQFLHKSTDKGETWEIISPDLTTNDPEKQKQLESGGLTYDVTQAENFTTIIAIEPSPLEEGVIWVGTDDGNLQLTRDGGETWANLIGKLPGVPAGSWVPQVKASRHQAGEAFVVINNYRRNDWTPYVFHTENYGQTWKRIADESKVWGYALSIAQDPVEPSLLFLGTEFGLYVSFDGGANWNKWEHGYPTVSTMDLVVHPREHDLVIGTFGRAAFVLDDIRPLREIAQNGANLLAETIHAFEPPQAVIAFYNQALGTRFAADAIYAGENRPSGAMLTYSVKEGKAEKEGEGDAKAGDAEEGEDSEQKKPKAEKVTIEVVNGAGEVIRTLKHEPKTGLNRVYWGLDEKGARSPSSAKPKPGADEPGGVTVLPGTYKVRFTYKGATDSTTVHVMLDPRMDISELEWQARYNMLKAHEAKVALATQAIDRLREAKETIETVKKQFPEEETEEIKALKENSKAMQDSIKNLIEMVNQKEGVQGIYRNPDLLGSQLGTASYMLSSSLSGPNQNQQNLIEVVDKKLEEVVKAVNAFFEEDWSAYQKSVEAASLSPFKAYDELKMED